MKSRGSSCPSKMPVSHLRSLLTLFYSELVPSTRFSAKPPHPNTFGNYQGGPNTPAFLSEADRFAKSSLRDGLNDKVSFQREDKERRDKLLCSKIAEKQRNQQRLVASIEMKEQD